MKKVLCAVVIIGIIGLIPSYDRFLAVSSMIPTQGSKTIVIDPGHGGMDGGASSRDGTEEKNINLAISRYLKTMLKKCDIEVIMTRDEDEGLYSDDGRSIRSKKTEDIKNRKNLIDETNPMLTVTIHLNSYPADNRVYGAQTFYPVACKDNEATIISKTCAETIQNSIEKNIEDGRTREAMKKNDIYLFKYASSPIVLVECGFLSNEKEAKMLKNSEYQRMIAKAIYEGICSTFGLKEHKNMVIMTKEQKQ